MRRDKVEAFNLRKEGKTYSQISGLLKVSKATLSLWFKDEEWSKNIYIKNNKLNYSPEKIYRMHEARRAMFEAKHKRVLIEATDQYHRYKNDPLFIAGLMLYVGEGDKSLRNTLVRITNAEHYPILIFKRFFEKFCDEYYARVRIWLLLYPDLEEEKCIKWWSVNVGIERNKFVKSQFIEGKHPTKKLLYGVATLIISSKFLKAKLLRWIELASKDLSGYTGG